MKKIYSIYKTLIRMAFIYALLQVPSWFQLRGPIFYLFSVDFIITLAVFLIVTLVVGKRQVKLLLYTTPIYGITSIITGYLANPSIIIVMVSVILGVGITLFLYDYYMYEYDFVS